MKNNETSKTPTIYFEHLIAMVFQFLNKECEFRQFQDNFERYYVDEVPENIDWENLPESLKDLMKDYISDKENTNSDDGLTDEELQICSAINDKSSYTSLENPVNEIDRKYGVISITEFREWLLNFLRENNIHWEDKN